MGMGLGSFASRRRIPSTGMEAGRDSLLPGIVLCGVVAAAAYAAVVIERILAGKAWVEPLVAAILIGTIVRSLWMPPRESQSGIAFCAKYLLELAVVLLGASVSAATLMSVGLALLLGIAAVVAIAIMLSFAIGRILGLPIRMALLVACGNSICGNSAIAAIAPVIDADSDDVAASIAFTAVLGVAVVLLLPALAILWGLSATSYGVLAGLTVYAVPQVLAAASPLGPAAVQMGTLVKLVRVLMLGPVCLLLSVAAPHLPPQAERPGETVAGGNRRRHPGIHHLIPWFILGFLALAACRSLGLLPIAVVAPLGDVANLLTVVSMAALGLGVDVRTVAKAGGRVTIAVILSLLALGGISAALLAALDLL